MSYLFFSGLCNIHVQGPSGALNYAGNTDGGLLQFTVIDVPGVTILDNRPTSKLAIKVATETQDFSRVYETLDLPALVSITKEADTYTVNLDDPLNEPAVEPEHAIWIATHIGEDIPYYNFLLFLSYLVDKEKKEFSFFSLYRRSPHRATSIPGKKIQPPSEIV